MTAYQGLGKLLLQVGQETYQGTALLQRAGVLRTAPGVKPSLVADADGAAVEWTAVSPNLVEAAMLRDGAVATDVEVIAHVDEATCEMVPPELLGGVVLGLAGGGAVNDEVTN